MMLLELFCGKYSVSIDRCVEMAIGRLVLSEMGIFLVPAEVLERPRGIAVVDEENGLLDLNSFRDR